MEEFDKLDGVFREGLKNAKLSPPPGVWEGIAASAGATGTTGITGIIAIKWFAALVAIGAVSVTTYYFATKSSPSVKNEVSKVVTSKSEIPIIEDRSTQSNEIAVENDPKGKNQNDQNNGQSQNPVLPNALQANSEEGSRFGDEIVQQNISNTNSNANPPQPIANRIIKKEANNPVANNNANPCERSLSLVVSKISNTAYTFVAKNPKGQVTWYFGDGNSISGFQTAHNFTDLPASYNVKAVSESLHPACKDSAFTTIVVAGPKPVLTNIFTPNGDGFNDQYYVEIQHALLYELTVLDLQKRVVFSSTDPNVKWDGSCKNIQCPEGKYEVLFTYRYAGEIKPTVLREILTLSRNNK